MKIILVSDFNPIPHEHALLNALFANGLRYFHLRKRDYSRAQLEHYLDQIAPEFYPRIVLHAHFDLARERGLKGIHFKKTYTLEDFQQEHHLEAAVIRESYLHISHSVHNLSDLKNAQFPYDYLFLSPVFDSISNQGYNSKIKIQTIRKFLKEEPNRPEVIALSGITAANVDKVVAAGFNGLGLLGFIWLPYREDGQVSAAVDRFLLVEQRARELQQPGRIPS